MAITKADLTPDTSMNATVLLCLECDSTYSANLYDYWWMDEGEIFTCEYCQDAGETHNLVLAKRRSDYIVVQE